MVQHPTSTHLQNPNLLPQLPGIRFELHHNGYEGLPRGGHQGHRQGMEKYLTISLGKYLVFKDSLQFLGSSLGTLAKNIAKTGLESFVQLRKKFHGFEAQDMRLLVRKGVYPYEYMDSWEKKEQHVPFEEADRVSS